MSFLPDHHTYHFGYKMLRFHHKFLVLMDEICIQLFNNKVMTKTIFITGASAGIGKATAKLFAEKGWNVIATMRKPENEKELNLIDNLTLLPLDANCSVSC